MSHPLRGKLSIDVDDQVGLGNLAGFKVAGKPILGAFFEPAAPGYGEAPRGDAKTLDTWRGFGFGRVSGLRFVPHNWSGFAGLSGSAAAKKCSDYISVVERNADGTTTRRVDVVEWDIETHDLAWQLDFLFGTRIEDDSASWTKGIRGRGGFPPDPAHPDTLGYRWGRPGVWTMEGRQDRGSSAAAEAAAAGLLIGPQAYDGAMTESWDWHFELLTWCLDANPQRPNGARIPFASMIPYYDARKALMPVGAVESVLFASSRLS